MDNTYLNIIIAAAVGSAFTLLVQAGSECIRNRRIKKAFEHFLEETIKKSCEVIRTEIKIVKAEILTYTKNDVSLGMHPSLNSRILKSFSIDKLYSVYGKKTNALIQIISILDNLKNRTPSIYFKTFIIDSQNHIKMATEEERAQYKSDEAHFLRCGQIEVLRRRTSSNLDQVNIIINDLFAHIDELK